MFWHTLLLGTHQWGGGWRFATSVSPILRSCECANPPPLWARRRDSPQGVIIHGRRQGSRIPRHRLCAQARHVAAPAS
eukprot:scaffold17988_cov136-Isochrysis_galbana.AAC.9